MQAHFAEVPGSAVLVPVVLTLPALVIALLAPFAGIIADRLGRKPLLLASMLLYVLCGVLPLWLESLPAIVLSRAGIGLAEAGIMTCCTTLMGDYYSGARRERFVAMLDLVAAKRLELGGEGRLARLELGATPGVTVPLTAVRTRGEIPSGFSLDASLTIVASSRPNSRATSAMGLPAW